MLRCDRCDQGPLTTTVDLWAQGFTHDPALPELPRSRKLDPRPDYFVICEPCWTTVVSERWKRLTALP